mmetsp:Transcript_23399/g.66211  ORF Transcript_23399/g.66211 Transcript_23399/m.66211 type:complete len:328 (+) Transcript_23399:94-1077(+)
MGAALLRVCDNFLDHSCLEDWNITAADGAIQQHNLHFKIRVDASPIRASMGTLMHDFKLTDELVVESIELVPGLEPLGWRHEREGGTGCAPRGPRSCLAMRYVRARINGQWVLLGVATASEQRTMENVMQAIEDSKDTASYAHSFNAHTMHSTMGDESHGDASEAPQLRVCVPVGCRVLSSAIPQFAHPGAVVLLFPFSGREVVKFVFDGRVDFNELPQAFFHHAVWMSGGQEMVHDIQGVEADDGNFLLVDPCVMRTPKLAISTAMKSVATGGATDLGGPPPECFDQLHPRCGQLCKGFDPTRRGAKARRMCGLSVPSCGVGGGSK